MAELTPIQARQSDCLTVLRELSTAVLKARAGIKMTRETLGQAAAGGLDPGAFSGTNSDLAPQDLPGLEAAFDAIEAILKNADGTPTAALTSLLKFGRVS